MPYSKFIFIAKIKNTGNANGQSSVQKNIPIDNQKRFITNNLLIEEVYYFPEVSSKQYLVDL